VAEQPDGQCDHLIIGSNRELWLLTVAKTPGIGTAAPDFTLPSVQVADGAAQTSDVTLSDQRGQTVVLAFYPATRRGVHETALLVHL